jgi:hypothetical protein
LTSQERIFKQQFRAADASSQPFVLGGAGGSTWIVLPIGQHPGGLEDSKSSPLGQNFSDVEIRD